MPTYTSALLPNTSGLTFGSSALRWTAYIQDMDIAGTPTFTGRVAIKNLEDIRFADQFTGTVPQQLDAAIAAIDGEAGGLAVAPATMGAGTPSFFNLGGSYLLDLRGVFDIYQGSITTPILSLSHFGIASTAFRSNSGAAALTGAIQLCNNDAIKWRVGLLDKTILSHSSGTTSLGGTTITMSNATVTGPVSCTQFTASSQIISSLATGTAPLNVTSTTVCPNLNVATLNGVTVSGAPTTGQALVATGVASAAWTSNAGTYKLENMQYTPNTFISSAGGAFFTYSLPANELAVGQALRVTVAGTLTNTSGGTRTFTFTLKAGATTLNTVTQVTSTGSLTNGHWSYEFLIICTASGSGGTVESQAIVPTASLTGMTNPTAVGVVGSSATVAFDTTSIQSLTFNVNQTNDATTATTGRQFMVERLG